jgi:hypothetical protein
MKKSNELYKMYDALVYDAKESIRDILSKQPEKKVEFPEMPPQILVEGWDGAVKVPLDKIVSDEGFLELYSEGEVLSEIHNSEWLYILECVEYEFS